MQSAGALNKMTVRVAVANRDWFNKHRDVAKRFMEALWEGREFNYTGGEKAIERYANAWKMPLSEAKLAPKFVPRSVTGMKVADLPGLIKLAEEFKFVTHPMSKDKVAKLVDYVYMPKGE